MDSKQNSKFIFKKVLIFQSFSYIKSMKPETTEIRYTFEHNTQTPSIGDQKGSLVVFWYKLA